MTANPIGLTREGETRLKLPALERSITMEAPQVDSSNRTLTFPFSSEFPVDRWFGREILSHDAGAADLSRLNDGAPLLYNHNTDNLIGVIERAWVDAGRGYVQARFGNSDLAQQVMRDVEDGILRNVSFGYRILKMSTDGGEGEDAVYRATSWAPYEVSLVTVPADPTVGIGRAESGDNENAVTVEESVPEEAAASAEQPTQEEIRMEDLTVIRSEAAAEERSRIASINALGDKFNQPELARQLVESGRSLDEARAAFLDKMNVNQAPVAQTGSVDMSDTERREYSLVRAINAALTGNWDKAGLEREVSNELSRQLGKPTAGFYFPNDLSVRAPYAVGAPTTGGNLVATNLLASSFIEVLRNKAMVMQLGPTMLTGLVGNVAIPRQTSQSSTYWVAEAASITESEALFDQVTLSPKQIGARSQYSRLALQQTTPDIEVIVRNDLAKVLALGIDLAAINGSGTNGQPLGILNQSGIGSVAMGTNGAAFINSSPSTSPSGLDQLIDLEAQLDIANALDGSLYYLTNAKVVAALKKLKDQYGGPLWTNFDDNIRLANGTPGSINGFPVARSNQVPANLTKGTGTNLSAIIFGDFSSLIVGMWGASEVLVNPYGAGYNSGSVDIRIMQTCDIAVRLPKKFAAITDIIA